MMLTHVDHPACCRCRHDRRRIGWTPYYFCLCRLRLVMCNRVRHRRRRSCVSLSLSRRRERSSCERYLREQNSSSSLLSHGHVIIFARVLLVFVEELRRERGSGVQNKHHHLLSVQYTVYVKNDLIPSSSSNTHTRSHHSPHTIPVRGLFFFSISGPISKDDDTQPQRRQSSHTITVTQAFEYSSK